LAKSQKYSLFIFIKRYNYKLTPKIYPTKADRRIAIVPHIVIRKTAFFTLDPPIFSYTSPKMTRKIVINPQSQYSRTLYVTVRITKSGKTPPTVNDATDAIAACNGTA